MNIYKVIKSSYLFLVLLILSIPFNLFAKTVDIPFDGSSVDTSDLSSNIHWTLTPENTYYYQADSEDGCEFNILLVTKKTFQVGVNDTQNRVVLDREWLLEDVACEDAIDDENSENHIGNAILMEYTADFYAQDMYANIWYFGENTWSQCDDEPDECEKVPVNGNNYFGDPSGSWLSGEGEDPEEGIENAKEGIVMLENPRKGDRYQQEYWEDEAEDWGAVVRLSAKHEGLTCLKTKEWTPLEPGHIEHKFYCDGVLTFIEELHGQTTNVNLVNNITGLPCLDIPEMLTGEDDYNDDSFTEVAVMLLDECSGTDPDD
jgi:hypothetical protein